MSSDGPAFFSLIPLFSWEKERLFDVAYRRWIEERRTQLATEIVAAREACRRGEAVQRTITTASIYDADGEKKRVRGKRRHSRTSV